MALIQPTDNDLITLLIKKVINESNYTATLYRDKRKMGKRCINNRQIKFYNVWFSTEVRYDKTMSFSKVLKKSRKVLKLIFGNKYKIINPEKTHDMIIINGENK